MIINGSAHLVDLDSEIIEVAGFGRFPGEAVRGQKIGSVFDLLGEKCLIARYALSENRTATTSSRESGGVSIFLAKLDVVRSSPSSSS